MRMGEIEMQSVQFELKLVLNVNILIKSKFEFWMNFLLVYSSRVKNFEQSEQKISQKITKKCVGTEKIAIIFEKNNILEKQN